VLFPCSFLYLRGHRSDDGCATDYCFGQPYDRGRTCRRRVAQSSHRLCRRFNWKLAVATYLVLETCSQQFLRPRVYKKARDTLFDLCAKQARPILFFRPHPSPNRTVSVSDGLSDFVALHE
jgi:hypothetical protein